MKKVLCLLLAYVFLQTESWALSGGPVFGGGAGIQAMTGTYAGVLLPDVEAAALAGGLVSLDQNAIGIFTIGVPESGISQGAAAFFNKGEVFTGKIAGVVDPDEGTLTALMEASAIRIITVEVSAGSAVGAFGSDVRTVGRLLAQITTGDGFATRQRLEGTAVLNSFSDANRNADGTPIISGQIQFLVDGFKQTDAVNTTTQISFDINSGSTTP